MAGAVLDEPWLRARERVPVSVFQDSDDISQEVAREIAGLIRQRAEQGQSRIIEVSKCFGVCGAADARVHRQRLLGVLWQRAQQGQFRGFGGEERVF